MTTLSCQNIVRMSICHSFYYKWQSHTPISTYFNPYDEYPDSCTMIRVIASIFLNFRSHQLSHSRLNRNSLIKIASFNLRLILIFNISCYFLHAMWFHLTIDLRLLMPIWWYLFRTVWLVTLRPSTKVNTLHT